MKTILNQSYVGSKFILLVYACNYAGPGYKLSRSGAKHLAFAKGLRLKNFKKEE